MSICEKCGKETVIIYTHNAGNICKDKINGEEEDGQSDKES